MNGANCSDAYIPASAPDGELAVAGWACPSPDGIFVTILKDGVNNTSVKNVLKGEPQ